MESIKQTGKREKERKNDSGSLLQKQSVVDKKDRGQRMHNCRGESNRGMGAGTRSKRVGGKRENSLRYE